MDERTFKDRTKRFGLNVIRLVDQLPRCRTGEVIGRQLLRSATSVGANYRSACRGRSTSDILSRLAIVEEEGDEAIYWLELLIESGTLKIENASPLIKEANEIVAMTVASIKTLRKRSNGSFPNPKSKIESQESRDSPNPKSKI